MPGTPAPQKYCSQAPRELLEAFDALCAACNIPRSDGLQMAMADTLRSHDWANRYLGWPDFDEKTRELVGAYMEALAEWPEVTVLEPEPVPAGV